MYISHLPLTYKKIDGKYLKKYLWFTRQEVCMGVLIIFTNCYTNPSLFHIHLIYYCSLTGQFLEITVQCLRQYQYNWVPNEHLTHSEQCTFRYILYKVTVLALSNAGPSKNNLSVPLVSWPYIYIAWTINELHLTKERQ